MKYIFSTYIWKHIHSVTDSLNHELRLTHINEKITCRYQILFKETISHKKKMNDAVIIVRLNSD